VADKVEAHIEKYVPRDNDFYREHYHHVLYGLLLTIFLLIVGLFVVVYLSVHRPLPEYHAVDPNGQKMSLTPYLEPNLLPDTILRWASKAAVTAYTFDFVNYKRQIESARPFFTEAGWKDYLASVSGLIDTIVKNKVIINGVVTGTPVISNQGPLPGQGYTWRVQIPFLVTYQVGGPPVKRNYYVVLTIVRVPTNVNIQGIGIDQFVMV
jgi:intracellular multiplication protein IcmL